MVGVLLMLVPRFKKDYEEKSLEDLIKEQQSIMKRIVSFENKYILKNYKGLQNNCDILVNILLSNRSSLIRVETFSILLLLMTPLLLIVI